MKTLNVIGCGTVGKTLARLWATRHVFEVRSVLNRSLESGSRAVDFVGSGHAVERYAEIAKADLWMISTCTPDHLLSYRRRYGCQRVRGEKNSMVSLIEPLMLRAVDDLVLQRLR